MIKQLVHDTKLCQLLILIWPLLQASHTDISKGFVVVHVWKNNFVLGNLFLCPPSGLSAMVASCRQAMACNWGGQGQIQGKVGMSWKEALLSKTSKQLWP